MVKYKSLLEKYCCNSVDGINYTMSVKGAEDFSREEIQDMHMKTVEDQYIPPWRAACDAWVTENVLDSPGDNTPVYQLYNAYIKDNPDDYMDIGQFGKVLRSRFPYRKRRRGKQGQQVYVYQDVALKKKPDIIPQETEKHKQQKSFESALQNSTPLAGPSLVVGNNSGGTVFCSAPQASDEEFGPLFNKRQGTESSSSSLQLSPSHKRQKVSKETGISGLSDNNTLRFQSSFSPHFGPRRPVAPTTSLVRQSQIFYNDKQNNDIIFKNKPAARLDKRHFINSNSNTPEVIKWTKVRYFENRLSDSKDDNIFDKVVTDIGTTNIPERFRCHLNLPDKNTQMNGFKNKQKLTPDVTFFKQKSEDIDSIGVTADSVTQPSDANRLAKYESSSAKIEDDKYASASLCRMAIGRRWIDANLIDKPGVHTYADDICRAYAEDHPDEPLTFTSLALLIRGKYPGRRRKASFGNETKYIYQDIKLLRSPAEKSEQNTSLASNRESVNNLEKPPTSKLPPQGYMEDILKPVPYLILPVIEDLTLTNNVQVFNPVNYRRLQLAVNAPLLAHSSRSSPLSLANMNPVLPQPSAQKTSLTFESLLVDDDEKTKFPEYRRTEITDLRDRLPRRSSLRLPQSTEGVEYLTNKLPDVTVSDYLANELLDINQLNTNINNCTLSIKVPSGKQEIPESIPGITYSVPVKPNRPRASSAKTDVNDSNSSEKKSWDYGIRKSVGIISDPNVTKPANSYLRNKVKRNRGKSGKNRKSQNPKSPSRSDVEVNNTKFSNTSTENFSSDDSTSSTFSKSSGGSPTSTSPPCTAMFRLAEEIDTSTPHVADTAHSLSTHLPVAATSDLSTHLPVAATSDHGVETQKQFSNPGFSKAFRSVVLTARQILSSSELPSETNIKMRLEKAVLGNDNPAVHYHESTTVLGASIADHFPCSVTPDLQNLMQNPSAQISDLLRHHQTCPGLGCSTECRTLRAAYIHMTIFRHKCPVWEAFKEIVGIHSKQCRLVSCGIAFCQYVKHELHVSGVSVLPMQLFKERPTLEEEFRKCEAIGTHDGDLHCRHMRFPFLPNKDSALKRRREGEQPADDVTMDTNFIFPDTPSGNSLAVPTLKTISLIKNLFLLPAQPN